MYEAFYNLSAGPFQLMPDPRFLFPREGHQRALSYLMYGLQRREGFVVITGDVGIGKTLLVQALIDEVGGRSLSVARVAMANLDADGVLPMVASAFGLPSEARSKVGLLNDLVTKILPTYNRGALLIVDEAQTCTPAALEELRVISNLQAHGRALLQVFLVGQSELRKTLAQSGMEQLRQRIITSYHLRALEVDEVRDYVTHRLSAAGWQADPELADAVYPLIHGWSGGVPRRINLVMDRLLLYGYLEELHVLGGADAQIVIDELNAEQQDEITAADFDPAATLPLSSAESDAMLGRIAQLENAFTAAVGDTRARQLLDKHEVSAQQKALVAMGLRIARLESLLADQTALDELQNELQAAPQSAASNHATPTPMEQAPAPAEQQSEPEPQIAADPGAASEPVAPSPAAATAQAPARPAQPAPAEPQPQLQPQSHHSHHHAPEAPDADDIPAPKWRLFSRRR